MENGSQLIDLYAQKSKHSGYQIISKRLSEIIGNSNNKIEINSRYESERLKYITSKLRVKKKHILDIGGNSGFFSFELVERGASLVHYYEGNSVHANFVQLAAKVLNVTNNIVVTNGYYNFNEEPIGKKYDIILLMNVLHHLGEDYGNNKISMNVAKEEIVKQLNSLAKITSLLVFQMGFNWKGNPKTGLFEYGTKAEIIKFLKEGIRNSWEIIEIGIAEQFNDSIRYCNLNNSNIKRNDKLGEFLNRPIFILKSLR